MEVCNMGGLTTGLSKKRRPEEVARQSRAAKQREGEERRSALRKGIRLNEFK